MMKFADIHASHDPVTVIRNLLSDDFDNAFKPENLDAFVIRHRDALQDFRLAAYGETLLHDAMHAVDRHPAAMDVACSLIRAGFDTNAPSDNGDTPLHAFCRMVRAHPHVMRRPHFDKLLLLLHTHHADLAQENRYGEAPMDLVPAGSALAAKLHEFSSYESFAALQEQRQHRVNYRDAFVVTLKTLVAQNQPDAVQEQLSAGLERGYITAGLLGELRERAMRGNRAEDGTTASGERAYSYHRIVQMLTMASAALSLTTDASRNR